MRLVELLGVLVRHEVEFVVVGGVAAVINGAPITTSDLDILHRRTPENVRRLVAAVTEIDATFRTDPRKIRPNESHLLGPGHALLQTTLGVLDSLGTIETNTTYEDVLVDTFVTEVAGLSIRALTLERLIKVKEQAGRPKDLRMLPELRATLAERNRR
jgi:tRNA A37 threonylcarbamoyladenosine dehydratase